MRNEDDNRILPFTVFSPGGRELGYQFNEPDGNVIILDPGCIDCVDLAQSGSILGWMHRRDCDKRSRSMRYQY